MGRFRFNLSDGEARQAHVKAANLAAIARQEAEQALENTFDPEAGKPTDNPFPEDPHGYNLMTVAQLKELCAQRGFPTSGNKSKLIERLQTADSPNSPEAPAEEAAVEGEQVVPDEESATTDITVDATKVSETNGDDNEQQDSQPA
jgi:hypothetical protein|tara:strand:- start:2283 stop:2720 length:438 start_codon:yes stop_codon:yes gene_type:complete